MDNVISQDNTFSYKYSAVENKEIQEIRKNICHKARVSWKN